MSAALILGLHLMTAHANDDHGQLHGNTPGIYAVADNGATAGVYHNSYGNTSAYAGWTMQTASQRFALTVGGVTGYRARGVLPLVVPSVRFGIADHVYGRVSFLARTPRYGTSSALNFSIEYGR